MTGDFPRDPNRGFAPGWIIGWLSAPFAHSRCQHWLWWDGISWGDITRGKRYAWRADADVVAVGLQLHVGEGEIRVQ